ncbi:MAG: type II toxin-antitoxin system VapC family toxin [Nitrososphaerales archaeon]
MFYVDSNIFLEVELKDPNWEDCKTVLDRIANGSLEAVVSTFHVYGIMLRIETETRSAERIEKFLRAIDAFEGLRIYEATRQDWFKCLEIMRVSKLDFDDSLVVACMMSNGANKLISLDAHFDKVKQIKRLEPKHVV